MDTKEKSNDRPFVSFASLVSNQRVTLYRPSPKKYRTPNWISLPNWYVTGVPN
jgi:hypothetical protein